MTQVWLKHSLFLWDRLRMSLKRQYGSPFWTVEFQVHSGGKGKWSATLKFFYFHYIVIVSWLDKLLVHGNASFKTEGRRSWEFILQLLPVCFQTHISTCIWLIDLINFRTLFWSSYSCVGLNIPEQECLQIRSITKLSISQLDKNPYLPTCILLQTLKFSVENGNFLHMYIVE